MSGPVARADRPPTICEVAYGSAQYDACCRLREQVLRVPQWMSLRPEDVAGEERQIHLAAVVGQTVVGCVVLKPLGEMAEDATDATDAADAADAAPRGRAVKLRQMAVAATHQRRGVGSALVRHAIQAAAARGFATMTMDARTSAEAFYERLGFACEGERYEIIGLPHVRMTQTLPRS